MTDAAMTRDAVARELVRLGMIVDGGESAPVFTDDRPWFITLVLGAAGWFAGLFALFFVWMLFDPDNAGQAAVTGIALLAVAFVLYFVGRSSVFFGQLALAFSIAGQFALVVAALEETSSAAATAAFASVMQLALLLAMPNRFAKGLAAFFFCIAWALTLRFAWWGESSFERGLGVVAPVPAIIAWFVVWAPIAAAVEIAIAREAQWMATRARAIVRPALVGFLIGLSLAQWASQPLATLRFWAETGTSWLALWPLLAAAAGLYAVISAFRLRDRALIGVAALGALLHVMQFYYVLGVSLLVKSVLMLAVGAALIAAARLLVRRPMSDAERSS